MTTRLSEAQAFELASSAVDNCDRDNLTALGPERRGDGAVCWRFATATVGGVEVEVDDETGATVQRRLGVR